ncbi:hypothetical protein E2C01_022873 [Portunus trituberculatus]|uniref:Uncharacterized protein n=1 Tax=Portunus trituberculatus TaxID=210409 RepID=A0A5B7E6J5_PORTR|nr:hypothetical protein [Portunus trituberculatus]
MLVIKLYHCSMRVLLGNVVYKVQRFKELTGHRDGGDGAGVGGVASRWRNVCVRVFVLVVHSREKDTSWEIVL